MKLNKNIFFSIFFLLCFVTSFGTSIYKDINAIIFNKSNTYCKNVSVSNKENSSSNVNEFVIEEEEDENENDVFAQTLPLPYLIVFLHSEFFKSHFSFLKSIEKKTTNIIYISICNFRI